MRCAVEEQSSARTHQGRPFGGGCRRVAMTTEVGMRPRTGFGGARIDNRRVADRDDTIALHGHHPGAESTRQQV